MVTEVLMPKLGLTMTEGTIAAWSCKEGDTVKPGDPLFSVETDKLTNDVLCEADGVLLRILLAEGETAPCRSVVAWIGQPGDAVPNAPSPAGVTPGAKERDAPAGEMAPARAKRAEIDYVPATPYAKKLAGERRVDLSRVPAAGPGGFVSGRDVAVFAGAQKASPAAAMLASELGVALETIETDGRVMKADVLAAACGCGATRAKGHRPAVGTDGNDQPPVRVRPLRRSIAANMSASWSISPRVTYTRPVDAGAMRELRAGLMDRLKARGVKLTYNHIIMKAAAAALMEFPDVNASFSNEMLTRHLHANVGLAVAREDGLIVPNVKSCEDKNLAQIAEETERLIVAARYGGLTAADVTGGTFTVSNLGSYGLTAFSPIINQPELAILGVCGIADTPVVRRGEVVVRPMMNLSLTADHRVIDGVMASGFLARICEILENPCLLLV